MVKNSCLFILLGFVVIFLCRKIESSFLSVFLHQHIITLTITLVAITSAVRAIILSKLTEINLSNKEIDFSETFKELKVSVYEQVSMIGVSIFVLIAGDSKLLRGLLSFDIAFFVDSILTAVLFYSIYILYDTAIAVIDIFIALNKSK